MKTSKIWVLVIPVIVLACMLIPAAALADGVGSGGSLIDPAFNEGIAYDLDDLGVGTVTAGDEIICEASAPSCSLSTPTLWSDVLVFYNSASGPYTTDTAFDANTAAVFSDSISSGFGSLNTFLSMTGGGTLISSNAGFIIENPTGPTDYLGIYFINSEETVATPEPGSLLLLGSGLFGIALKFRRKLAA